MLSNDDGATYGRSKGAQRRGQGLLVIEECCSLRCDRMEGSLRLGAWIGFAMGHLVLG